MHNIKSDEDLIREFKEFENSYENIDKDRLLLYVVWYLESKEIEPTLQKITAAAFKLFPKSFSLLGFPEYPDGFTVYYTVWLHDTKTKGLLVGSVQSGFSLSNKGRYYIEEVKKILSGEIKLNKVYRRITKTKESTFIEMLKKTTAYEKYKSNAKDEISEWEILKALRAETDPEHKFKEALRRYTEYAIRLNDTDILNFLKFLEQKMGGKYG